MSQIEVKEILNDVKTHLVGKVLSYPTNKGLCRVVSVDGEEGPIYLKRRKAGSSANWDKLKVETISSIMIWRYVNALNSGIPVNVDRVLGASYNTRSVLEAIISHCPNFFLCRPKRITDIGSTKIIYGRSHKCLIFNPNKAHRVGTYEWDETIDGFITEIPSGDSYIDAINVPNYQTQPNSIPLSPDIRRVHSQMQVNLTKIAKWFNLRSWLAVQDHGIVTGGKNIMSFPSIVQNLNDERVINNYPNAINVAKNVDCIWFNGGMPYVFEVEHTTGVTSGLNRMIHLMMELPHVKTNYVVVAPDSDRNEVVRKASFPQFRNIDLWYMPYSSLLELTHIADNHPPVNDSRLIDVSKSFMERLN